MGELKVFLVQRTDGQQPGQVREQVVLARDRAQALELVSAGNAKTGGQGWGPAFPHNLMITELDLRGEPMIICTDMLREEH